MRQRHLATAGTADDTFVVLGSRGRGRGGAAVERLQQAGARRTDRIQAIEIDVASDESVDLAARDMPPLSGPV